MAYFILKFIGSPHPKPIWTWFSTFRLPLLWYILCRAECFPGRPMKSIGMWLWMVLEFHTHLFYLHLFKLIDFILLLCYVLSISVFAFSIASTRTFVWLSISFTSISDTSLRSNYHFIQNCIHFILFNWTLVFCYVWLRCFYRGSDGGYCRIVVRI